MVKVRNTAADSRVKMLVLHEEGYSSREIAVRLKCSHSTVTRLIQKVKECGQLEDRKRSGRPRKSSVGQDRMLRRTSLANRKLTSPELAARWRESCSVDVSTSTVRRRCLSFGLRGCRAVKKPLLTAVQRKTRVAWARKYSSWTPAMWSKVLFSDESTFCILGNQSNAFVRRFKGENLKPECMNMSVKYPTKIMVWGCMASSGLGRFHIIEGMMNAVKYIKVLQDVMIPSAQTLFMGEYCFQDDNAPCHRAKSVVKWMADHRIQRLDWPAQSPDLNPIENLWSILATQVHKAAPRNKRELIEALIAAWYRNITPDRIQKLVQSMPKRCKQVIRSKGWPIGY